MMRVARAAGSAAVLVLMLAACGGGPPGPAALLAGVTCSHCRMSVSDQKLSAQLVASGEEPRFFDDIGCLVSYLKQHPVDRNARAYVADHATGAWIAANDAVFSRDDSIATPMGSHLIAHASDAARGSDPSARNSTRLAARDVFGAAGAPGGTP